MISIVLKFGGWLYKIFNGKNNLAMIAEGVLRHYFEIIHNWKKSIRYQSNVNNRLASVFIMVCEVSQEIAMRSTVGYL